MSGIRVTYTGLVSFASRLAIILVNMIFVLVITRTLGVEEYGVWGVISNMLVYVVSAEVIIGYWTSREIARGGESGRTAIISSGMLSGGGAAAYVAFALLVGGQGGVELDVILLAAVLVPLRYAYGTLMKINLSWRPHTTSYALVAQSVVQIPLALLLVRELEWGIPGVILTVLLGQTVCNVMLAFYTREKLGAGFDAACVGKWFRLSWVSLYPSLASVIYRLDVILFTLITGSVVAVASWTASFTIAFVITHSALVSTAIYPKLLEGGGTGHLRGNFTLFFYIGAPLTAMTVALAEPGLFLLNPAYQGAHMALGLLSIGMFLAAMATIFQTILEGNERVDAAGRASFRDYMRSKLFLMPTIDAVQYGLYVAVLAAGFVLMPEADLLVFWALSVVVIGAPFTIYRYVLVRRITGLGLEVPKILKYVAASAGVFGAVHVAQREYLNYTGIYEFLPVLLGYVAVGVVGYFAVTYVIDRRTRELAGGIISELRGAARRSGT